MKKIMMGLSGMILFTIAGYSQTERTPPPPPPPVMDLAPLPPPPPIAMQMPKKHLKNLHRFNHERLMAPEAPGLPTPPPPPPPPPIPPVKDAS